MVFRGYCKKVIKLYIGRFSSKQAFCLAIDEAQNLVNFWWALDIKDCTGTMAFQINFLGKKYTKFRTYTLYIVYIWKSI